MLFSLNANNEEGEILPGAGFLVRLAWFCQEILQQMGVLVA